MKLKNKLLPIIAPAAILTTIAPITLTSCGVTYTTQVRFGKSSTVLCNYQPCQLSGYDEYYATTEFRIIMTGDEAVTIKASNISITCKGKEYKCKGFGTLGSGSQYITSVATEFKFSANSMVAQYVMFDNDMWETYKDETTATAKINNTANIPLYVYSNITFNL